MTRCPIERLAIRNSMPVPVCGGDKYIATSWILFNPAEALFTCAG